MNKPLFIAFIILAFCSLSMWLALFGPDFLFTIPHKNKPSIILCDKEHCSEIEIEPGTDIRAKVESVRSGKGFSKVDSMIIIIKGGD